jgi:hypothetical protein
MIGMKPSEPLIDISNARYPNQEAPNSVIEGLLSYGNEAVDDVC